MKHQLGRFRQWMFLLAALGWYGILTWLNFQPSGMAVSRVKTPQSPVKKGRKLFNPTCSSFYCPGAKGAKGSAPPLRGRNFTAEHLTRVISEGVPGTPMPAFKNQYS